MKRTLIGGIAIIIGAIVLRFMKVDMNGTPLLRDWVGLMVCEILAQIVYNNFKSKS